MELLFPSVRRCLKSPSIDTYNCSHCFADTVNLFHLPSQRLIGLRYLTRHYFDSNDGIQDASRGHDSIEDALGALRLKNKYDELKKNGELEASLKKLYAEGHAAGWKN